MLELCGTPAGSSCSPTELATASAVALLSPVTMMTRMPAWKGKSGEVIWRGWRREWREWIPAWRGEGSEVMRRGMGREERGEGGGVVGKVDKRDDKGRRMVGDRWEIDGRGGRNGGTQG